MESVVGGSAADWDIRKPKTVLESLEWAEFEYLNNSFFSHVTAFVVEGHK